MLTIQVKARDKSENLDTLRGEGQIPAVFYGASEESTAISTEEKSFLKVWHEAGESSAVKIESPNKSLDVLIQDVQVHPVTDKVIHVDFLAIDMTKKVEVSVPLEFTGTAPAIKNGLGTLVKVLHEVDIEALPKDLPHNLEVDLNSLVALDDQITVADLKAPLGVEILTDQADTVVSVVAVQEEKEEEPEPIDLSEIEVEGKGKEKSEDDEGSEGEKSVEENRPETENKG